MYTYLIIIVIINEKKTKKKQKKNALWNEVTLRYCTCMYVEIGLHQRSQTDTHVLTSYLQHLILQHFSNIYGRLAVPVLQCMCSARMRNLDGCVTCHPLRNRLSGYVTGWPDALPVCQVTEPVGLRNHSLNVL